ncbi:MAG: glucan ABC transporter ATP-binding protein/ permease [Alphaproteobacteria bacterium]|nr:glucan ABC transporter ATP-binding protein/ permease [Alphaproteobacteria bacterium]
MELIRIYKRALGLLSREGPAVIYLALANAGIGIVLLAEPVLFGSIVDALARQQPTAFYVLSWASIGLLGISASVVVAIAADRMAHRRRLAAMADAFDTAITLPISYHSKAGTGATVRNILAGSDALFGTWLTFLREQLAAFISVALLAPLAFWMEWRLALMLVLLATVYVVLNIIVVYQTSEQQSQVEREHIKVSGRVGDVVSNVSIVQSYARLSLEVQALRNEMDRLLSVQYPVLTWWGILTVLNRAAATVTMICVFAFGATLIQQGVMTVGEVVSFVGFATLLIGKLDVLSGFVARLFMQAPTLRTYFELLDSRADVVEDDNAGMLENPRGDVRFENVTYRYDDQGHGVFNVDFTVPAGKTVALVGPTGAGKTTALALLQRIRDPDDGRILIGGQDIRRVNLTSLRQAIAVVFQDAGLFNRSLAENIRIGRPDADDAQVRSAANMAQAGDFISRKPGTLDFIAGERGGALSGGERQRLAIARAILKDAPILILDEATSALDTETESRIKTALDALRQGRTTFIIAHRLSTVADADQILVLDQGRIIERGSFQELKAQGGMFSRLVAEGGFTEPKPPAPAPEPALAGS